MPVMQFSHTQPCFHTTTHLHISASEWQRCDMTPTQTSGVHQWGPIKDTWMHTCTLNMWMQYDYKTCVDHIPTALCCVSPHHPITNICAFLGYYSDSLTWPKTSLLHVCLITHFLLSPISCTAAAHMATSCCGRSYTTVEGRDWLFCPGLFHSVYSLEM